MPGTPHPASGSPLRRGRLATATPTAKRKQNVKSKSQSLPNPKEQKKTTGTAGATATFLGTLRRGLYPPNKTFIVTGCPDDARTGVGWTTGGRVPRGRVVRFWCTRHRAS